MSTSAVSCQKSVGKPVMLLRANFLWKTDVVSHVNIIRKYEKLVARKHTILSASSAAQSPPVDLSVDFGPGTYGTTSAEHVTCTAAKSLSFVRLSVVRLGGCRGRGWQGVQEKSAVALQLTASSAPSVALYLRADS